MDNEDNAKTLVGESHSFFAAENPEVTQAPLVRTGDMLCDRYEVREYLGEGAMGIVYRCYDTVSHIEVAVKMLSEAFSKNKDVMEDVRYNFELVEKLKHENIAALKHLVPDESRGGAFLLVMEFAQGKSLQELILEKKRKEESFSLESTAAILRQLASAIDYAHSKGVVHRDLKPGNIIVGDDGKVLVLDFGLAARLRSTLAHVSVQIDNTSGTPAYKSPEQWRGRPAKAPIDQYALGVMAYEMLAGVLPFDADDPVILRQAVLSDVPEKIDGLPESAWNALVKALAKEGRERFESCTAFVDALSGKSDAGAVFSASASEAPRLPVETPKAIVLAYSKLFRAGIFKPLVIIVLLATVGVGICFFTKSDSNRIITLPNGIKIEMVRVEPGTFTMSREDKDGENADNEVAHNKTLTKAFYIGKYEVTQEQYEALMKTNPSEFKGAKRPVERVCWYDAVAFCQKMNLYAPDGWKFTLPTETQWEFAARGGRRSRYCKYSGSDNIDEVAWYDANSGGSTHNVGGKKENELGLYDMSGNVWEWCLDDWEKKSTTTRAEFTRPYRGTGQAYRVYRGGSWNLSTKFCRSAYRRSWSPFYGDNSVGFRLALVPVK